MKNKSDPAINNPSIAGHIGGWLFGVIAMLIGIINLFWGNDPGYGIFIFLLSFAFFPPFNRFLKKISGISLPLIAKIVLALFIIWSAVGVGELFDKIEMMVNDFK